MLASNDQVYGSILISSNQRILLIKGRTSGKWSFPKGHSRQGETELEAASRETYEETGIFPPLQFDRILHLATGTYFVYSCDEFTPIPLDTKEVVQAKWMDLEEIRSVSVNVDINTFLRSHAQSLIRPTQRKFTKFYKTAAAPVWSRLPTPYQAP